MSKREQEPEYNRKDQELALKHITETSTKFFNRPYSPEHLLAVSALTDLQNHIDSHQDPGETNREHFVERFIKLQSTAIELGAPAVVVLYHSLSFFNSHQDKIQEIRDILHYQQWFDRLSPTDVYALASLVGIQDNPIKSD